MEQTTTPGRGTAAMQGELWGTDAPRWAAHEEQQRPLYADVADRLGVDASSDVLDVGCGSGVFLRLAADRGATVTGLDASEGLVDIARTRVPEADIRLGDLEELPFQANAFDVVTGFNSFQFASDMTNALREAARVVRPGGRVVLQVWGRADHCDLTAMLAVIGPLLPFPPPSGPGGRALADQGVLEELATAAGLMPLETGDVVFDFVYPDEETMVATQLSAGIIALAARTAGEETVRAAILAALAPFRTADGGYRLQNEWHYLIAKR
jgi:SAM-dependent methyltransferase